VGDAGPAEPSGSRTAGQALVLLVLLAVGVVPHGCRRRWSRGPEALLARDLDPAAPMLRRAQPKKMTSSGWPHEEQGD
jgi:hypothetical protein